MARTMVMVGTRKGLWVGISDESRTEWEWAPPHFPMEEVYSVVLNRRSATPRLLAGCSSSWFGPQLRRSDDLGQTWQETPNGAIRFPDDARLPDGSPATLSRVWQLTPGFEDGVVWAGTEPGAIFRSADGGETFSLVRGLWDHPHRVEWNEGFGGQAFHTILPHPADGLSVLAALSTGGVYRTSDGGSSWAPANEGVKAEFYPGERNYPEFGQCVHKVARDAVDPERLFLQNHGGVYRSDDGGSSWQDIATGLPSEFGFAIITHPRESNTAYTFPIDDAGARWPVDGKARVCRTTDGGSSWEPLGEGSLPDSFYAVVLRDAMCADDHETTGLYFGGRNGAVWCSPDSGTTWLEIQKNLPDVLVVRAAVID